MHQLINVNSRVHLHIEKASQEWNPAFSRVLLLFVKFSILWIYNSNLFFVMRIDYIDFNMIYE